MKRRTINYIFLGLLAASSLMLCHAFKETAESINIRCIEPTVYEEQEMIEIRR